MLRRSPDAALEVIKYSGNRLKEAQEKTENLALDRADHWLASLLVDRATLNGMKDPNGIRLTVRMTRQDMANYEGVGQAVTWLGDFFRFYNEERRHHTLAYRTRAEVCKAAQVDGKTQPPWRGGLT